MTRLGDDFEPIGRVYALPLSREPDQCILNAPVGENAERSLVEVHDGVVDPLVAVDDRIRVKPDNQVIAKLGALLQEVLNYRITCS